MSSPGSRLERSCKERRSQTWCHFVCKIQQNFQLGFCPTRHTICFVSFKHFSVSVVIIRLDDGKREALHSSGLQSFCHALFMGTSICWAWWILLVSFRPGSLTSGVSASGISRTRHHPVADSPRRHAAHHGPLSRLPRSPSKKFLALLYLVVQPVLDTLLCQTNIIPGKRTSWAHQCCIHQAKQKSVLSRELLNHGRHVASWNLS